jgi:hypothetical protein
MVQSANSTQLEDPRQGLQSSTAAYEAARKAGDAIGMAAAHANIIRYSREVATLSEDPKVREEWALKTERLEKAESEEERNSALHDIGIGLAALVAAPFIVVGGVLFGVGKLVQGIGRLFSWPAEKVYEDIWKKRGSISASEPQAVGHVGSPTILQLITSPGSRLAFVSNFRTTTHL